MHRWLMAVACLLALGLVGCGDDADETTTGDDGATTSTSSADENLTMVKFSVPGMT